VAIGASDTVGTGARNPATEGWVPQLHAKMPKETRLANLGIAGLKMHDALEQVLPVAVDLRPTTVTIWLAVNDLAAGVPLEQYQEDLNTMLATLARETEARVYVANVPDLTLLPVFRSRQIPGLGEMIAQWNTVIAATVAANGAILVDLHHGWAELRIRPDYVSRDGFHPSTLGHRRLAEIFWSVMEERGQGTDAEGGPTPRHTTIRASRSVSRAGVPSPSSPTHG
jgi:lysophospholipase L1-like esterase